MISLVARLCVLPLKSPISNLKCIFGCGPGHAVFSEPYSNLAGRSQIQDLARFSTSWDRYHLRPNVLVTRSCDKLNGRDAREARRGCNDKHPISKLQSSVRSVHNREYIGVSRGRGYS